LKLTCDDSVRTSDSRDDVLDDSLGQTPGDSLDAVILCSSGSLGVKPFDVIRIVGVNLLVCIPERKEATEKEEEGNQPNETRKGTNAEDEGENETNP